MRHCFRSVTRHYISSALISARAVFVSKQNSPDVHVPRFQVARVEIGNRSAFVRELLPVRNGDGVGVFAEVWNARVCSAVACRGRRACFIKVTLFLRAVTQKCFLLNTARSVNCLVFPRRETSTRFNATLHLPIPPNPQNLDRPERFFGFNRRQRVPLWFWFLACFAFSARGGADATRERAGDTAGLHGKGRHVRADFSRFPVKPPLSRGACSRHRRCPCRSPSKQTHNLYTRLASTPLTGRRRLHPPRTGYLTSAVAPSDGPRM
mmetsp:Transcript_2854/g.10894  ORF Transcript_2854/g.10894 Transcript_2854/m.10894 type:complete len:265 (-) Transcript_2854:2-796(-)